MTKSLRESSVCKGANRPLHPWLSGARAGFRAAGDVSMQGSWLGVRVRCGIVAGALLSDAPSYSAKLTKQSSLDWCSMTGWAKTLRLEPHSCQETSQMLEFFRTYLQREEQVKVAEEGHSYSMPQFGDSARKRKKSQNVQQRAANIMKAGSRSGPLPTNQPSSHFSMTRTMSPSRSSSSSPFCGL